MKKKLILSVDKLQCKRNNLTIFNFITFKAYEGSLVMVRGQNGKGKTSFMHCLCGLIPYKGKIKWNIRSKYIGYVGHQVGLKDYETVEEFILFWKKIYNSKLSLEKIVNYFSLEKLLYKPIAVLSFGQKKKLSFVRIVLTESKIWLLDEPYSGMDTANQRLITKIINTHLDDKGLVILSTHEKNNLFKQRNKQELIIV